MRIGSILVACGALSGVACGKTQPPLMSTLGSAADSMVPIADVAPPGSALSLSQPAPVPRRPPPPPPPPPPPVLVPHPAPQPAEAPVQSAPSMGVAPTPAVAPLPVTPVRAEPSLAVGRPIETTAIDSAHSRFTRAGDLMRVTVTQDVSSNGTVLIPAGSVITLVVDEISGTTEPETKGILALTARDVEIDGRMYPLGARASDYEYEMRARGVGAGDVAKAGAGAVAGGVLGRVIGGNRTGTLVGAAAGAAGGAAFAAITIRRDIIVHAGANITLTLVQDFTR